MNDQNTTPIALVTGGSRGIGRAIACQLALDGYDIAFCYNSNNDAAETVKEEIESNTGRRVLSMQCDVADFEAVKNMMETLEEQWGNASVIINNAGINSDSPLPLMKLEDWKSVVDTNLNSVFNVCRAATLMLIRNGSGCIVNMSSMSGVKGNYGQTNYAASKAGIIGFSKSLAKELGRYKVRVNVVAPGLIDTDMVSAMDEKMRKEIKKSILLKRIGSSEDVANAVSFLCSEKATYITGQTLQVDGGLII